MMMGFSSRAGGDWRVMGWRFLLKYFLTLKVIYLTDILLSLDVIVIKFRYQIKIVNVLNI